MKKMNYLEIQIANCLQQKSSQYQSSILKDKTEPNSILRLKGSKIKISKPVHRAVESFSAKAENLEQIRILRSVQSPKQII